jgi:hypothetical protein
VIFSVDFETLNNKNEKINELFIHPCAEVHLCNDVTERVISDSAKAEYLFKILKYPHK